MLYTDCHRDRDLHTAGAFSEDQIFDLAIKEEQRISLARDDFTDKDDRSLEG